VTAVDRSPGTVSGCLVLGSALAQQWGAELAAERVLPVLTPLLTSPSLSPGHFAAALECACTPSCEPSKLILLLPPRLRAPATLA
jgi:hypothetical protein